MSKVKKTTDSVDMDLDAARAEAMRIRFRKVLGENVPAHVARLVRKNIAKLVKTKENEKRLRRENA